MSKQTDKVSEELQIFHTKQNRKYIASSKNIPGTGFGDDPYEAKHDLLCKNLLSTEGRKKIMKALGQVTEEAPIGFAFEFKGNHCLITATDLEGRSRTIRMKIKERNPNDREVETEEVS